MYGYKWTIPNIRVKSALCLAISLTFGITAANAADQRSGNQRREDARTCARLGTVGAGTVTCMKLLPRVSKEREDRGNRERTADQRRDDAKDHSR